MITQITNYISQNWVVWLFLACTTFLGFCYKSIMKMIKEDRKADNALREGVQALLRDRIIHSYNKYTELGFCPVFAKENVNKMYDPYHELGGNDVATDMVTQLLQLPPKPSDENTKKEA